MSAWLPHAGGAAGTGLHRRVQPGRLQSMQRKVSAARAAGIHIADPSATPPPKPTWPSGDGGDPRVPALAVATPADRLPARAVLQYLRVARDRPLWPVAGHPAYSVANPTLHPDGTAWHT